MTMSTAIERCEAQLGQDEDPAVPSNTAEYDSYILWQMRKIRRANAEMAHNDQVAREEIARVENWRDAEKARLQHDVDYAESLILHIARAYDFGGRKSRKLPLGEFGSRSNPASIKVVDESAMLAFAKAHDIPVKVKESVAVKDLKEYTESSGMLPDGVEAVPGSETWFVRVSEQ